MIANFFRIQCANFSAVFVDEKSRHCFIFQTLNFFLSRAKSLFRLFVCFPYSLFIHVTFKRRGLRTSPLSVDVISVFQRWQRRWFVLYDDGELTYSVDEHVSKLL